MRTIYLVAIALLFSLTARAQTQPSDVDLKTAYCLKVKQRQAVFLNQPFDGEPPGSPAYAISQKILRDHTTDLNRLQSYLLPKMKSLEPMALIAAANRAEADLNEVEALPSCAPKCRQFVENGKLTRKWEACMDSCRAESPAALRVYSCADVNWLPF